MAPISIVIVIAVVGSPPIDLQQSGGQLIATCTGVEFSDGQWRWCTFVTPEILSGVGGEAESSSGRLLMYDAPHMIVVNAITRDTIENSIAYIESQGRLLECSMRCGEEN